MRPVLIGGRKIGAGNPCFLIAEAGVNHNGSADTARELIDAAAKAGADAVKFQTFDPDELVVEGAPTAAYQRAGGGEDDQLKLLRGLCLPVEALPDLKAQAEKSGLIFLSAPFDLGSARLLDRLDVVALKIPSGELTNLRFLRDVTGLGRPMIVSTGMSTMEEVEAAVEMIATAGGGDRTILLHCVSEYPAPPRDVNLKAMDVLRSRFDLPVGFSDHTLGTTIALAAVARGACVLEKHFTLSRDQSGPDHRVSLEPDELAALVGEVRQIETALGSGRKVPAEGERETAAVARKSLVAARGMTRGTVLEEVDVAIRRPGTGLSPGFLPGIVGRKLTREVEAGELITLEMLE